MKQIFGYTAPEVNPGETYVKFLAVCEAGDAYQVQLRNGQSVFTTLMVPKKDMEALAEAISPLRAKLTKVEGRTERLGWFTDAELDAIGSLSPKELADLVGVECTGATIDKPIAAARAKRDASPTLKEPVGLGQIEVSGPYHYVGDMHPCFRVDQEGHPPITVMFDGPDEIGRARAEKIAASLQPIGDKT